MRYLDVVARWLEPHCRAMAARSRSHRWNDTSGFAIGCPSGRGERRVGSNLRVLQSHHRTRGRDHHRARARMASRVCSRPTPRVVAGQPGRPATSNHVRDAMRDPRGPARAVILATVLGAAIWAEIILVVTHL